MNTTSQTPSAQASGHGARPVGPAFGDGLEAPERNWAAATLLVGILITALDISMTSVALPDIAKNLQISAGRVVWVIMANTLAIVMTLLPFSVLAERIGFRRMFTAGLTVFMVSALACALSSNFTSLLAARVCQGLGASMLMCLFGGLVRHIYPMRLMRFGISLNALATGLLSVLGPTIGAFILDASSWHWIFLVLIPPGIATYFGVRFLPDVSRRKGRFDWAACALSMLMFASLILGLDALAHAPLWAVVLLLLAGLTGLVLVHRSRDETAPFVPVDLFRITPMAFAAMASALSFAAQMAAFVSLPFYFLTTLGKGYTETGMFLGVWSLGVAIMAPLSGFLIGRFQVAVLCGLGAFAMALAMAIVVVLPVDTPFIWFAAPLLLGGIGFGFFQSPNNHALLTGAPKHRSAAVGALQAIMRVFGQSFGTALVAIGFNIGGANPAIAGVGMAILCALGALVVNIVRYFNPAPDVYE